MHFIKIKLLTFLAIISFWPWMLSLSAITVMSPSFNKDGNKDTAINTISNFEVLAGNNRKLVVTVCSETVTSLTGITFGGQSFTKAVDTGTSRLSQIWYLDDATVGTADIVATFDGNSRSLMGVISLAGMAAGGPSVSKTDLNFIDTDPMKASVDITTTAASTIVIGAFNQNSGNNHPLNPSSMAEIFRGDSGSSNSASGYEIKTIAGQSTYTWEAQVGFQIHPMNGVAIAGFDAIPEPSSYALFIGFIGLCFVLLRNR